jgi:hypothetical protein
MCACTHDRKCAVSRDGCEAQLSRVPLRTLPANRRHAYATVAFSGFSDECMATIFQEQLAWRCRTCVSRARTREAGAGLFSVTTHEPARAAAPHGA